MQEKRGTLFQRLDRVVGPAGSSTKQPQPQRYNMDPNVLVKTDNKAEYEMAKLEAQQNKLLGQTWKKVEGGLFQQSINYETTRIASYADFESMEFYPTIAAALDVISEEATTINDHGRIMNIYSDSTRIKGILEDLFFNRLDLHTTLPMFTRNMIKYGDNFLFLNIDKSHGVIGGKQLPNYEMERRESGLFDMISGKETSNSYESGRDKVKFFWRGRDVEFNSWQIAHFRLLGDDRRLPYGTSILEKSRRIWKQLLLSEDSMLVYRVTRAPERRVYKIYVGNIDDADVGQYVNEIADRFKRTPIVDPQTGQMDLRYNQLSNDQDYFIPVRSENSPNPIETLPGACIALDTRIPLLDGRTIELNEIIKEWDNGNRNLWVYSCNPENGKVVPGRITWAGETRKNTEVLEITLDNGEKVITTPDHKWVHRTKGFVEAKDLVVGDSLMPYYSDMKKIKKNKGNEYHRVWDSSTQKWVFTHRMVTNFFKGTDVIETFIYNESFNDEKKTVRHHKDFNRFNNNPDNIVWMNSLDHLGYHRDSIKKTMWANPELNKEKIRIGLNRYIANLSDEQKMERGKISANNSKNSTEKRRTTFNNNPFKSEILRKAHEKIKITKSTQEFKDKASIVYKKHWTVEGYRERVFSKPQKIIFTDKIYQTFSEVFQNFGRLNETLKFLNDSNEFMSEFRDTNKGIRSSLTNLNEFTHNHVDKMFKEQGFNNFRHWKKASKENYNHKIISIVKLSEKQDTGTITVDGNEIFHNYHTFAIESGVFIKNSNLSEIADIEYLQKNLFTSLRVPKPFLGFEESAGDGKNLALQDIRFSRTINRVQQSILQELNKIAIIHLYILGFEDDLDNFTLTLNNPSTQAEMLKVEHMQLKVTLYKDAVSDAGNGFGAMSMTRAKREILGWSDDEIKKDLLEQRMEKAASAELANTSAVIKHTGMFDTVDRIYGDFDKALEGGAGGEGTTDGSEGGAGGGLGGSFGGGGAGGEDLDFGAEEELGDEGNEEIPNESGNEPNGENPNESKTENPNEPLSEKIKRTENLLVEQKKLLSKKLDQRTKKYSGRFVNLYESIKPDNTINDDKVKITDKSLKINENINSMISEIDNLLD